MKQARERAAVHRRLGKADEHYNPACQSFPPIYPAMSECGDVLKHLRDQERQRLIAVMKNRFAARHPWGHRLRKWPIIGRWYLLARDEYIQRYFND